MTLRRLLYVGSLVHPDRLGEYPEVSAGSNMTQLMLLRALRDLGVELSIVTPTPAPARRPPARVASRRWHVEEGIDITATGYLSSYPLKPFASHRAGRRAALAAGRGADAVLAYNAVYGSASAGLAAARRLRIPFVDLVADYDPPSRFRSVDRKLQAVMSRRLILASDGLIVHSPLVVSDLGFKGPWIHMDGILGEGWETPPAVTVHPMSIAYCGTLGMDSGLERLLDAFAYVRSREARLRISGRGPAESAVRARASRDPRIEVMGFLPRREMQALMSSSTLLVNPRPNDRIANRYNFPGKLLDYLASGRPVVSTLTGGMAHEYRSYVVSVEDERPAAFGALLEQTLLSDPRKLTELGTNARKWVLQTRNAKHQAERVTEVLQVVTKRTQSRDPDPPTTRHQGRQAESPPGTQ